MAQNLFGFSKIFEACQQDVLQKNTLDKTKPMESNYQWNVVWRNVIVYIYLHLGAFYGLYILLVAAKVYTFLWSVLIGISSLFGITAGVHRLWAHKSYKAKWPMRVILMIFQTMAFQNSIYVWARDHRVHHKFMDTDADPHNAERGFFFSHMGWLLVRKHPEVTRKAVTIDMSDLEKDFVVVWQRRYYMVLMPLLCFLLPTWVPCHFWGEKLKYAWYATIFRYTLSLHITWLVNSAAHKWGMKPYDNTISATDSYTVGITALGEGWHNYHHIFPWDYKTAELGNYRTNFTTAFIDLFARIGWAYDLKTVTSDMIKKRAKRTGDGSKYERMSETHHTHKGTIWGWGDADMAIEDIQRVDIINKCD